MRCMHETRVLFLFGFYGQAFDPHHVVTEVTAAGRHGALIEVGSQHP